MDSDFDTLMAQTYRMSRDGEEALRASASRRGVLYDVLFVTSERFITARKNLVRAASKSPTDQRLLNDAGYNITDEEIEYLKELDNEAATD